jgi:hypothetical protein
MAKLNELKGYGKTVTIFRLFDGRTYQNEESNIPLKHNSKGGRFR